MRRFKSFLSEQRDLIITFHHKTSVQQRTAVLRKISEKFNVKTLKQLDGYYVIGECVNSKRTEIMEIVLIKDKKARFKIL